MGMCIPKEYGGTGADPLAAAICVEELSKQCASTGDIVATHNGLCCDPILTHGTEEQKKKYLPMLTTGHKVGAFALTEPNAGSKSQTEAKLEGDHYVMNGSKIFITNGYVADVFVVFAMTDKSKGTKGISAFIVESSFPGFSVGKHEEKMGLHGSPTAEIVFTDCIVPKENLLGKEGQGFKIAMMTLDGGRIGIASQALGIAEGAFEIARKYLMQREQFKKPLYKNQHLAFRMVDLANEYHEKLMDAVVGVSGSSPAYVFLFLEALADGAVQAGMPRAQAYRFAAQSIMGSAALALETGKHPGELKDMVCSPGGTTIEAVQVLEDRGFRSSVMHAVSACVERCRALSKDET